MFRVDLTVAKTFTHFYVLLLYSLTFLVQIVRKVRLNAAVFFFLLSQGLGAQHQLASAIKAIKYVGSVSLPITSAPPHSPQRARCRCSTSCVPIAHGNEFLLATGNTSQAIAKSCPRNRIAERFRHNRAGRRGEDTLGVTLLTA